MNSKQHMTSVLAVVAFGGMALATDKPWDTKSKEQSGVTVTPAGNAVPPKPPEPEAPPEALAVVPAPVAKIGDIVDFEDSTWVVLEAKDGGKLLKNKAFHDATTEGRFILVRFKVTNKTGKEEDMRFSHFPGVKVVDAKGREFSHIDFESFYVPKNAKVLSGEKLPPGLAREFWGVFEVAADAADIKFQARELAESGSKTALVATGL